MNAKRVTIMMRDGTVFQGFTNIGSARRLSDFFKKSDSTFITIFDAVIGDGVEPEVYFINKNHILWAKPGEPVQGPESDEPF